MTFERIGIYLNNNRADRNYRGLEERKRMG